MQVIQDQDTDKTAIEFNYHRLYDTQAFWQSQVRSNPVQQLLIKVGDSELIICFDFDDTNDDHHTDSEAVLDYGAFETGLDNFLDADVGESWTLDVSQYYAAQQMTFTHLDDEFVEVIGPCGMRFAMLYEELDAIYGAMPELR